MHLCQAFSDQCYADCKWGASICAHIFGNTSDHVKRLPAVQLSAWCITQFRQVCAIMDVDSPKSFEASMCLHKMNKDLCDPLDMFSQPAQSK